MATRAETLISQHARGAIEALEASRRDLNNRSLPAVPIPAAIWRMYREYCRIGKRRDRLDRQMRKRGWSGGYSTRPHLMNDTRKEALRNPLTAAVERVKTLQRSANLAVLGKSAEEAAPIVRKFVKDLAKVRR